MSTLLLLPTFGYQDNQGGAPVLESPPDEGAKKEPERFERVEIGDLENFAAELNIEPTLPPFAQLAREEENNDKSPVFEHKPYGTANGLKSVGPSGSALVFGHGPELTGFGGFGGGLGTPNGIGFCPRPRQHKR